MAKDYTRIAKTASRLVAKYGRTVSLIKLSTTPADPLKPWEGVSTLHTTVEVDAVFVDPVSEKDLGINVQKSATSSSSTISSIAYIAAYGILEDLETFDRMVDDGRTYTIEQIDLLKPGTTRLLYVAKVST